MSDMNDQFKKIPLEIVAEAQEEKRPQDEVLQWRGADKMVIEVLPGNNFVNKPDLPMAGMSEATVKSIIIGSHRKVSQEPVQAIKQDAAAEVKPKANVSALGWFAHKTKTESKNNTDNKLDKANEEPNKSPTKKH